MNLAVGTYFWSPDEGSKFAAPYTPADVERLRVGVHRNLTLPHEFIVITDQPGVFDAHPMIRAVPLDRTTHVPGTCFVRLMTYHPDGPALFGAERLLQMDLDTLVVGNIDHIAAREENIVLWRNPALNPKFPGRSFYQGSLALHRLGSIPGIWEMFRHADAGRRKAWKDDQWYLSAILGNEMPYFDGARDGVYRIAREDTPGSGVWGDLPDNACIVTFPGSNGKADNPRVLAANPWIAEFLA
jgi:hypothetical protein